MNTHNKSTLSNLIKSKYSTAQENCLTNFTRSKTKMKSKSQMSSPKVKKLRKLLNIKSNRSSSALRNNTTSILNQKLFNRSHNSSSVSFNIFKPNPNHSKVLLRNKSTEEIRQFDRESPVRLSVKDGYQRLGSEEMIYIEDSTPNSREKGSNGNRFFQLAKNLTSKRKSSTKVNRTFSKLSKNNSKTQLGLDILNKSKAKSRRENMFSGKSLLSLNKGAKKNGNIIDITDTSESKKKNLYQRIEKLKMDVSQKNKIRLENQNLKEMQNVLMNRLEEQDEYFNKCMFGKQQEVDQLHKKLKYSETENKMLRESLLNCQNELRKCRKLIGYYPTKEPIRSGNGNGKQNLLLKLEEQLKQSQNIVGDIDISNLQTNGLIEGMSMPEQYLNLQLPQMNSGRMQNCGNTYLDLNLVVNNINSNGEQIQTPHISTPKNNVGAQQKINTPPPFTKQSLHRFIIDEEMIEEDSERMDDNLRQKMRAEAREKLIESGQSSPKKINQINPFGVNQVLPKPNNKNYVCRTPTKISKPESPGLDLNSFKKLKDVPKFEHFEEPTSNQNMKRGQQVTVCTSSSPFNQSKTPKKDSNRSVETHQFSDFDSIQNNWIYSKTVDEGKYPSKTTPAPEHQRTQSGNKIYAFGIKPELAQLLNQFNEIPLDQLQKDIEMMEKLNSSSKKSKNDE